MTYAFCGSGSTGVAALSCGLRFLSIELTREYFDVAANRITDFLEKNPA